jgi:protoporphyrinogen oxidase
MHYGKRVVRIDLEGKEVFLADGSTARYNLLISTLPLNKMLEMTGVRLKEDSDPYTSVFVLNIGATRGPRCPEDHWIYVPRSKAGFHRVGFYSNVDSSFLPASSQPVRDRVSIYVEKAYPGGQRPSPEEVAACSDATVKELCEWGFVASAEVVDPTWIDVAYTWSWPGSNWRVTALKALEERDVIMVGRYGRWVCQGIADSIRDGFFVGAAALV